MFSVREPEITRTSAADGSHKIILTANIRGFGEVKGIVDMP